MLECFLEAAQFADELLVFGLRTADVLKALDDSVDELSCGEEISNGESKRHIWGRGLEFIEDSPVLATTRHGS